MTVYIKFDNLQGDVTHKQYKGYSLIQSLHLPSIHNGSTNKVGKASYHHGGLPEFAPIQVMKPIDHVTPNIFSAACQGRVFKEVKIIETGAGDDAAPLLETTLKNVRIADYSRASQAKAGHPREAFHLTYSSITERYTGRDSHGSLKTAKASGFDLEAMKEL
jgi:type VI secretion system Hcp family effector